MGRRSKSRRSGCERSDGTLKAVFPSFPAAQKFINATMRRMHSGRAMVAYPCADCGRIHVGRARRRKGSGGGW
jgi:predicted RNA-binding Zn-ribbon protein involved in translation (DUF1610 family)